MNRIIQRHRLLVAASLSLASIVLAAPASPRAPGDYVDPRVGGVAPFLRPTYPTVHQPNQMLRTYPNNRDYLDDQIDFFPLQILAHRVSEILHLRIAQGDLSPASWKRRMAIDQDLEIMKPWFYQTELLDDAVTLTLAPGKKGVIYEVAFTAAEQKHLLISGTDELGFQPRGSNQFVLHERHTYVSKGNFTRKPSVMSIFVYGEVVDGAGRPIPELEMVAAKGQVRLTCNRKEAVTLVFKYALSYISEAQAQKNFEAEIQGKALATLSAEARAAWENVLGRITVQGGTESQRRTFYSALYRSHERMVDINEGGHFYSGYDGAVHETDRPFYVDDGIWDTYRALHPLRTILDPRQEEDMLNSLVQMSVHAGDWMPTYARPWGNHPCMVGYHTACTFLDAHRKGLGRFDIQAAYAGIKNNVTRGSWIPWRQGAPQTELDRQTLKLGYLPSLQPGEPETEPLVDAFERRQPVAVTLSRSFDFWAASELAKDLGLTNDHAALAAHSRDYQTLWHPELRLFMPKDKDGQWVKINPKLDGGPGFRDYFDENNGWTYAWLVQHDIKGLMDLLGCQEAMVKRLDELFREPLGVKKGQFFLHGENSSGMVGQFSMGNELSFHIPYLYNYCGAPWKTQQRTRFLLDVWFKDNVFGNPGDEDGGAMAAWVVLASLGLYQVTPGIPVYTITSPVFAETTIQLPEKRTFKISALNASKRNKYIQSAWLNGAPLDSPFIRYEQIMHGGELALELGEAPNQVWGSRPPF